jgi:N-acetylglucosaminyldiphosphoundecaprenol N-acetyl-beta-D-mannosaminyltransferase
MGQAPSSRETVMVGGWPIDNVTLSEAVDKIVPLAEDPEYASLIFTPNVSHIRRLRRRNKYATFRAAYKQADMLVADGNPLVVASKIAGSPLPERVTGVDIHDRLCERLAKIGGHIIYLGGKTQEINDSAIDKKRDLFPVEEYPNLRFSGRSPSMEFGENANETADILGWLSEELVADETNVLFVCAGAPKSEIWAAENAHTKHHPDGGIPRGAIIPVGAAINYAAEEETRASERLQKLGLEGTYRAFRDPLRIGPRHLADIGETAHLLAGAALQRVIYNGVHMPA